MSEQGLRLLIRRWRVSPSWGGGAVPGHQEGRRFAHGHTCVGPGRTAAAPGPCPVLSAVAPEGDSSTRGRGRLRGEALGTPPSWSAGRAAGCQSRCASPGTFL